MFDQSELLEVQARQYFRSFVEDFGTDAAQTLFDMADDAVEQELEGVTLPAEEGGGRYSVVITGAGVSIRFLEGGVFQLARETAALILSDVRNEAEAGS